MNQIVDLIVLRRDTSELPSLVRRGILMQRNVRIRMHEVVGTPRKQDECRWETIARARNRGKSIGDSPWLMFLDDDVVLGYKCVRTLLHRLMGSAEARSFGSGLSRRTQIVAPQGACIDGCHALSKVRALTLIAVSVGD